MPRPKGGEVLPAAAFDGAIGEMLNLGNALRTFLSAPCLSLPYTRPTASDWTHGSDSATVAPTGKASAEGVDGTLTGQPPVT